MSEILETTPVIEVANQIDYTDFMAQILATLQNIDTVLQYLAGFGLFFVVVLLCYFCYKFFRIFF